MAEVTGRAKSLEVSTGIIAGVLVEVRHSQDESPRFLYVHKLASLAVKDRIKGFWIPAGVELH
jgi:hypothetical protein